MSYSCVNKYLFEPSENPQRMTVTCGQTVERQFVSMSVDEVSRETALKLADSKYFEAAFDLADNRKALRTACEQARNFYREHLIQRNPFPPKHKFLFVPEKTRKAKKESVTTGAESAKRTESSLSLLEGTMSLTSLSSHSQLSATSPSHPVNLKTPKKSSSHLRIADSQYSAKMKKEAHTVNSPALPSRQTSGVSKDENRLMNTFNTTE